MLRSHRSVDSVLFSPHIFCRRTSRAAEALEREAAMERKVQSLELELKAERAGREATQAHMLEADEGAGEREAAWEAQRRILVDDAERLRMTLYEATRERDELRLRVAALEGGSADRSGPTPPPSGSVSIADMMLERKAYEAEVSELFVSILLSLYLRHTSLMQTILGERAVAHCQLSSRAVAFERGGSS